MINQLLVLGGNDRKNLIYDHMVSYFDSTVCCGRKPHIGPWQEKASREVLQLIPALAKQVGNEAAKGDHTLI